MGKDKKNKKQKEVLTKEEKREQNGSFKERFSLKFRKNLITSKAKTWLLIIVLVVLFVLINAWAQSKATAQIDVTENKIYTLSQASKDQLQDLDKEIIIYIYGYEDSNTYVNFVKQYAAFNKNIKYEIVTTETNYEIINKYNLDDSGYGALVVVCGDKDVTLYPDYQFSSYEYEDGNYLDVDLTEESITNAILNVSTDDPIKVYFVTGHGELVTSSISELQGDLEELVYECEELNLLSATEIPADCDVLAIMGPSSDISESEANVLKSYINDGGNMFVSMYKSDENVDYTNFQSVLDLYGAEVEYGLLYEGSSNNCYSYGGMTYPYMLIANVSSSSDITSDLATSGYYPILPYTQRVLVNETSDDNYSVSTQELLYTSNACYNITDSDSINQGLSLDGMEQSAYTVASKYIRTLNVSDDSEDSESSENAVTSNLILVGNETILKDYYSYTGNRTFVLNCFADLAEQDNLLTIRKYTSSSSSFTKTATTMSYIIVRTIVFGLPVIIILAGIIIWAVRRRKR